MLNKRIIITCAALALIASAIALIIALDSREYIAAVLIFTSIVGISLSFYVTTLNKK